MWKITLSYKCNESVIVCALAWCLAGGFIYVAAKDSCFFELRFLFAR